MSSFFIYDFKSGHCSLITQLGGKLSMADGLKSVLKYGGAGGGTGAALSIGTGAKAVGLLGGVCTGSAALPVFVVAGVAGGLAALGIRMAFKKRRW